MKEIDRLLEGNKKYIKSKNTIGDISTERRLKTSNGQSPFAVVVTCSDSRVIPEAIFNVGIGDIFVIRLAGNVIGDYELASIEYACSHLGAKLVMIMGHTGCGAIHSAIIRHAGGYVDQLLKPILAAIGEEKDEIEASKLNAIYGANVVKNKLDLKDVEIVSSIYDINTGLVTLL